MGDKRQVIKMNARHKDIMKNRTKTCVVNASLMGGTSSAVSIAIHPTGIFYFIVFIVIVILLLFLYRRYRRRKTIK